MKEESALSEPEERRPTPYYLAVHVTPVLLFLLILRVASARIPPLVRLPHAFARALRCPPARAREYVGRVGLFPARSVNRRRKAHQ